MKTLRFMWATMLATTLVLLFNCGQHGGAPLGQAQQLIVQDEAGNCWQQVTCPGTGGAGGVDGGGASSAASSVTATTGTGGTAGAGGISAVSSAVSTGVGGSLPDPGILIASTKFDCVIGFNVDGSNCPSDFGWQDTARTPGVGCDGSPASMGDTGPTWIMGSNAIHSKYIAWTRGALPGGLVIDGNAVELNDKLEQNRIFRRVKTWARAELSTLVGTRLDLANHPFLEHGDMFITFVGYELNPDISGSYCFGHLYDGLGASSCMWSIKTEEVLQFGTTNYENHWGFYRTAQGVATLGPSNWHTNVLLDNNVTEFTIELSFDSTDPVSTPDQSVTVNGNPNPQPVASPACPFPGVPCRVYMRSWINATLNPLTNAPNEAPIQNAVLTNFSNVVGNQGGWDVLELGCAEQAGSDTLHDGILKWIGIGTTFYASRGFQ